MRAVADNFSGDDQSPSQTPLVSGCDGLAARAQAKTWGNRASTSSALFFSSTAAISAAVAVVGFIPQIPGQYPRIIGERPHHALHILFESRILRRIL